MQPCIQSAANLHVSSLGVDQLLAPRRHALGLPDNHQVIGTSGQ